MTCIVMQLGKFQKPIIDNQIQIHVSECRLAFDSEKDRKEVCSL